MSELSQRVTAIVLAAGMSTRMGTLKQLLPLNGKPLLETVLDNLRQSCVDEVILVLGHSADQIRGTLPLAGVRVVMNDRYTEGMGTSLRVGLANAGPQTQAALVVLADQPFLKPATIDQLIAAYRERKPQIVVPTYNGFRGNPVLLDHSVFPELSGLSGDMGCRAIFGSHTDNILQVPVDDIGVLLDVDTKADLDRFQRAYESGEFGPSILEEADVAGRAVGGPELIVVGQDAFAKALIGLGRLLHFRVTVIDPLAELQDFPGADRVLRALDFSRLSLAGEVNVVVASRGRFDEEAVQQALASAAAYVALVANKKRVHEIIESLRTKGVPSDKLNRLHAPAGIDIGAESPEEIALSVLAEVVSERRRRLTPRPHALLG